MNTENKLKLKILALILIIVMSCTKFHKDNECMSNTGTVIIINNLDIDAFVNISKNNHYICMVRLYPTDTVTYLDIPAGNIRIHEEEFKIIGDSTWMNREYWDEFLAPCDTIVKMIY